MQMGGDVLSDGPARLFHRQIERMIRTASLGIALVLVAFAFPSGASAGDADEAAALARDEGLSLPQAREDVAVQARAGDFADDTSRALRSSFAGAWFDVEASEFVIDVTGPESEESQPAIQKLARDHGVSGHVRVVEVDSSWADLLSAQRSLLAPLRHYFETQQVSSFPDPRTNAVVVRVSDDVAASELKSIQAAADASRARVAIQRVPAKDLRIKSQQSCSY